VKIHGSLNACSLPLSSTCSCSSPTCLLTGKRRGGYWGADVAGLPAGQGDSDGWRLAASPTAHLLTGSHALFMRFGAGKRCQKV